MVVLELRLEEFMLKEYSLKDGDRLTIGRHPEKDIAPKDAAVSKQHAVIERVVEKLIVLDRESRNGTFVNGMEVQSAELNDEDIFKLKVKDKNEAVFQMNGSIYTKKCYIIYLSEIYKKRLKDIYNNYLSEFRKDKHKGKKDMSSGL